MQPDGWPCNRNTRVTYRWVNLHHLLSDQGSCFTQNELGNREVIGRGKGNGGDFFCLLPHRRCVKALLGKDGRALTRRKLKAKYLFDCSCSVPAYSQRGLGGNWEPVPAADGIGVSYVKINWGTLFLQPRWAGSKRWLLGNACSLFNVSWQKLWVAGANSLWHFKVITICKLATNVLVTFSRAVPRKNVKPSGFDIYVKPAILVAHELKDWAKLFPGLVYLESLCVMQHEINQSCCFQLQHCFKRAALWFSNCGKKMEKKQSRGSQNWKGPCCLRLHIKQVLHVLCASLQCVPYKHSHKNSSVRDWLTTGLLLCQFKILFSYLKKKWIKRQKKTKIIETEIHPDPVTLSMHTWS